MLEKEESALLCSKDLHSQLWNIDRWLSTGEGGGLFELKFRMKSKFVIEMKICTFKK